MLPIADVGRWLAALLLGLMLALLLLIAGWLLRVVVPVAPTVNLSAVQMPAAFAATVGAPDPVPVLKASLDESREAERRLRVELASRQDDLRKQLETCKRSEPPLPAERWSKGDLATLKGCWVLGRDAPMVHTSADGRKEQVTVKAGRICFDDRGGGLHEQVMVGATARWDCKAPTTAKFWSNGTLVTNQPAVMCDGQPPTKWAATQLTCHRVSDELALCDRVDRSGYGQVEFRREP
jgi:hypothetical protein